jgi:DNA transformation protein and related proteins
MADPKGDKLYVNLGPSQVRRRLKGFGHGVRKVQSAGRNQAVIIHTAWGRNLAELQAKFADVGYSSTPQHREEPIENLPNIGPTSAAWLRDVGILTIADLMRWGAVAAYERVRQRQPSASQNLLWALAAGLEGRDWRQWTAEDKDRLRDNSAPPFPLVLPPERGDRPQPRKANGDGTITGR